MLSYMLPVEEKSPNSRNLSLNLNLQNTTTQSQTSSDTDHDQHEPEDADENTKLLSMEREDYVATKLSSSNRNGNLIKNGGSKINYNMNITNGSLCNNNLINNTTSSSNIINNNNNNNNINNNNNNNSIIKNGDSAADADTDDSAATTNENTVNNNINGNDETNSSNGDNKKIIKMSKLGSKNVTLKRVSFGSSKGSMVETLIFETPTPLPEHAEREFFSSINPTPEEGENNGLNDSGIELQEELERSKVRVTFFQSSKPQQVSPPCSENQLLLYYGDNYFNNNTLIDSFLNNSTISETDSNRMTAVLPPDYNRQASTDSGWDNPFRPDGDLSREADEIVNMIKGGKPITPTGDHQSLLNGSHVNGNLEANGTAVVDGATKLEASPLLATQQNGTKSPQKGAAVTATTTTTTAANGDAPKDPSQAQTQVSNQTVPGPQSASRVVIDEKKKKGRACCVIQ